MKMLARVLALALFTGAVGSARSDDDKAKAEEVKKLQGTWKITSAEFAGKAMEVKQIGIDRIVVAGDKMTLKGGDKEVAAYTFEVMPDKKPKGLVWIKEQDKNAIKLPVIYELDGTKIKLCFPLLKTEPLKGAPKPPESFDTKDKPLGLLVAEKQKE